MARRFWSQSEIDRLSRSYADRPTKEIAAELERTLAGTYSTAKKLGLQKSSEYLKLHCRLQKGSSIGTEHRFQKGLTPANKGLRRPGWASGRMRETQFKKGELSGAAANNCKPIGTIQPDNEGYLRIKVRERVNGKPAGWHRDIWPLLHHQIWQEQKGPIPPKHIVAFKDGDRSNCKFENLELLSMAENAHRNRMWNRFPRELAEAIQLGGVLKRKLRSLHGKE